MVAHIGTGLWWNQFGWNRCFWSEPETLRGVRWACVAMLDPVTAGSTERFMSREEKRSKWHFRNSSLAVVCRLDRGGKRWNCILMEENSRTWWLTGKEGQERSGRSMPKETKLFGQVQHQNNFVKSWKPWEQAINDSINFLYPPKAWASPGTSPFWWSHPLASYSTQFSPTPPPHQKALFCSKQEHFLEPSLSLKPDPPSRRHLSLRVPGRQRLLSYLLWGPGWAGGVRQVKTCIFSPTVLLSHFVFFSCKCFCGKDIVPLLVIFF